MRVRLGTSLLGFFLMLLALPSAGASQGTGGGQGMGARGTSTVQPDDITEVAVVLARAWAAGDMDQLARLLSPQGIYLRLGGFDRASLSVRLAEAALRDFLRGYEQGQVQLVRTVLVSGMARGQPRGFAEFRWQTRVPGTSHAMTQFIFMGLAVEEAGWRVNEVRILP